MQRVGYDADTQTYTYQDANGRLWEGEEGNRHGRLHRNGHAASPSTFPVDVGCTFLFSVARLDFDVAAIKLSLPLLLN